MDIMKLIKSNAGYWTKKLKMKGCLVEFDDVVGELGVAFAEGVRGWDRGGQHTASFKTYISACFTHKMEALEKRLSSVPMFCMLSEIDEPNVQMDITGVDLREAFEIVDNERRVIFWELAFPSEKVKSLADCFDKCRGEGVQRGLGKHPRAIAGVYGLSVEKVNYEIKKIKEGFSLERDGPWRG